MSSKPTFRTSIQRLEEIVNTFWRKMKLNWKRRLKFMRRV